MAKNKELWSYNANEKVWVGKYQNSQNISHWHNDCELIYVCQGEINIMNDKVLYNLKPGDSFFIDSKKIHNMQAQCENTIIMIIVFDNMDRLPNNKVQELWSSIHTFFAEKKSPLRPVYCTPR